MSGFARELLRLIFLGTLGVVAIANAQTDEDSRHLQPNLLAPPVSLVPQSGLIDFSSEMGSQDLVPAGEIAVRALNAVTPDSLGLIDELNGGFPVDMWSGTPKDLVDILLPKLPTRVISEASRSLMSGLLLSVARPPEPSQVDDVFVDMSALVPSSTGLAANINSIDEIKSGDGQSIPDLGILERRVSQLARMGDWKNVRALIELLPTVAISEAMQVMRTNLVLVEGGLDVACLDTSEQLPISENPYWQKVFAFCQLSDGNIAGAFLTIDLLREIGIDDAAFFWAAEIMSGNRPITPNGLRRLTPLQLAMLRSAGRPFPSQLVRNGDPTLLRVLAEAPPLYVVDDDDNDEVIEGRIREALDQRIGAAEGALSLGALEAEVLRALYRDEIFEEDRTNVDALSRYPQGQADGVLEIELPTAQQNSSDIDLNDLPIDTVRARARLFKLAESQTIPTARAEVISRAIDFARGDRGRNGPDVATMGLIYAPLVKNMTPVGDLDWFSGNAARALLAAGETEAGRRWLELSQLYARTSIEAADVAAAIWPVERQLEPTIMNRFTPLRFKRWEETRPFGRLGLDKTLVLSTFAALGESVTNADWFDLMDGQGQMTIDMPSPQIWNGMSNAANNKRLGETVLFALLALEENRLSSVSPIVLSNVIDALLKVGLEAQARRLAIEAAIIQGL
ncbi:MAG: hypothetical protein ACJZ9F_00910 [Rhodospirillaceae bacterium]